VTVLTGRKGNFVRIQEEQYQADIAAAEERGRASAEASFRTAAVDKLQAMEKEKAGAEVIEKLRAMEKQDKEKQDKAAGAAGSGTEQDAHALSEKIKTHIAGEAAKGRRIGYAIAAAELSR
jgi:hypothetical protein